MQFCSIILRCPFNFLPIDQGRNYGGDPVLKIKFFPRHLTETTKKEEVGKIFEN